LRRDDLTAQERQIVRLVAVNSLLHELSVLRRQVGARLRRHGATPLGSNALAQLEAVTLHVKGLTLRETD
jgi:hypothetical protein